MNDSKWAFNQIEERVNGRNYFQDKYSSKEFNYGIIQEIYEIIEEIKKFERDYDLINPKKQKEKLKELRQKLSNILGGMERRDKQDLINQLPDSLTRNLPEPQKNEAQKWRNKYGLR